MGGGGRVWRRIHDVVGQQRVHGLQLAATHSLLHYAVDVVVGAALVALCLPLEPTVNRLISRWIKTP